MEYKTISQNCLNLDTLNFIGLSWNLNAIFFVYYCLTSCIGHSESYYFNELHRSSKCWQISFYKKKSCLFVSVLISFRTSLCTGDLSTSLWWMNISQNSTFHLKAQILSLTTNTVSCFLWHDKLTLFLISKFHFFPALLGCDWQINIVYI